MKTDRDPYRSMVILACLIWVCAVFMVISAVLLWISAFESQRWATAIVSTVLALIVLGAAIQLTILMSRYRWQSRHEVDRSGPDGE